MLIEQLKHLSAAVHKYTAPVAGLATGTAGSPAAAASTPQVVWPPATGAAAEQVAATASGHTGGNQSVPATLVDHSQSGATPASTVLPFQGSQAGHGGGTAEMDEEHGEFFEFSPAHGRQPATQPGSQQLLALEDGGAVNDSEQPPAKLRATGGRTGSTVRRSPSSAAASSPKTAAAMSAMEHAAKQAIKATTGVLM